MKLRYSFVNNVALWKVGLRMVSNCFKYLITHTWEWGVKNHQNQSPFNFKTIFSRVLWQVKQTITSIKLLIGISKRGRQTVDNQSRSVLQPFYYVLIKTLNWHWQTRQTNWRQSKSVCFTTILIIKTMALMTLAESRNAPCVQAWHVYWSLFVVYHQDTHNDR